MKRALLAVCLLVGPYGQLVTVPVGADLDDLKRQSDDAADKARDAEESAEACRSSKGMAECRSKLDDHESAKDSLDSALEDVASKIALLPLLAALTSRNQFLWIT